MSAEMLQQVQALEEQLHGLDQRDQDLCHEDTPLHEKLLLLQKEQRLHPQPLRQALDRAERGLGSAPERRRAQGTSREAERKSLEEAKERREEELQRRMLDVSQETRQTEEQLNQQRAQMLAKISDLDQDLLRQEQEHKAALERVESEEEQRKDIELQNLVSDKKLQVELAVKAHLISLWSSETSQNECCFSELAAALEQTTELWTNIDLMSRNMTTLCREVELKTDAFKHPSGKNDILNRKMKTLSEREKCLRRRKVSLNEQKAASLEFIHKLNCDCVDLVQEQELQSEKMQSLSEELRTEKRRRKGIERSIGTASEILQEIIQTPQSSWLLVQKMQDLLWTSSSQISDSDFALFSIQQFHGEKASDVNFEEESERRMKTLTDPLFLLKCVRRSDVKIWNCSSWTRPWSRPRSRSSSAPSSAPSLAPHAAHRGSSWSNPVWSQSMEPLCELEQYQQRAPSPVYDP